MSSTWRPAPQRLNENGKHWRMLCRGVWSRGLRPYWCYRVPCLSGDRHFRAFFKRLTTNPIFRRQETPEADERNGGWYANNLGGRHREDSLAVAQLASSLSAIPPV